MDERRRAHAGHEEPQPAHPAVLRLLVGFHAASLCPINSLWRCFLGVREDVGVRSRAIQSRNTVAFVGVLKLALEEESSDKAVGIDVSGVFAFGLFRSKI